MKAALIAAIVLLIAGCGDKSEQAANVGTSKAESGASGGGSAKSHTSRASGASTATGQGVGIERRAMDAPGSNTAQAQSKSNIFQVPSVNGRKQSADSSDASTTDAQQTLKIYTREPKLVHIPRPPSSLSRNSEAHQENQAEAVAAPAQTASTTKPGSSTTTPGAPAAPQPLAARSSTAAPVQNSTRNVQTIKAIGGSVIQVQTGSGNVQSFSAQGTNATQTQEGHNNAQSISTGRD